MGVASATGVIDRIFARFIVVGCGNTLLGLAVIFAARQFVTDVHANMLGYVIVVPVSFLTHRYLSFRDKGDRLMSFLRYVPTVAAGYAVNLQVLSHALAAAVNPYLAQTASITSHVMVAYLLSRLFVFLAPEMDHTTCAPALQLLPPRKS